MSIKRRLLSVPLCFVWNMVLVYVIYEICRLVFLAVNWGMFADSLTWGGFMEMLRGGWFFDTSAILYTNALYALLMLFPVHYKETRAYQLVAKWVFVVCNAICVIANLIDCVYFQYTTRRTTVTVFSEFKNENNIAGIFGVEFLRHWYLVLIGVLLIAAHAYLLCESSPLFGTLRSSLHRWYARRLHDSGAPYYHQQCQSVCGPSFGGGYRAQHSFLLDQDDRQEGVRGARLLYREGTQ